MSGFHVILFLILFLGSHKRLMVKNTWVKEGVKNWHAYKRLKQHYEISFNSKMAWHCHRLKRQRAWILRVMTILTLVYTRCTQIENFHQILFYFLKFNAILFHFNFDRTEQNCCEQKANT